jgi:hypothetical protein
MVTQTVINKMDPEIEAYKLGLLGDAQGLVQGQMFGQNVQNLRQQYQGQVNPDTGVEYTPDELNTVIAKQLSTEGNPLPLIW